MRIEDYLLLIHQQDNPEATVIPPDLMTIAWDWKTYRYPLGTADECDSFDAPALIYYLWKKGILV